MFASKSKSELLKLSQKIVQPLFSNFHKGQAGRIAVIGGCEDYTGAPFFSAQSAALVGCDLSHIICEKNAATVIKSYLPDLMVHPYLLDSSHYPDDNANFNSIIEDTVLPKILSLLNRIHLVIIGPGFGRDPLMLKTLSRIIEEVKVLNLPLILDADALYLVSQQPKLIANYPKAIITPNVVEFERLVKAVLGDVDIEKLSPLDVTKALSTKLGGVTIVRKGGEDMFVKGDLAISNDSEGLVRRVGGQGDTLTGTIGTFLIWSKNYENKLWGDRDDDLTSDELTLLACFAGSTLVREASRKAFRRYGRSMQTLNIHEFLGESYAKLFSDLTLNL